MKYLFFIFLAVACMGITSLQTVSAAETTGIAQLAQCSGADCSACNVVYMANGLITWLIGILCVIFAVILAIAGVKLVTSGGNASALDAAKSSFTNAIIGFLIVLSAWLIIDTIMRSLIGNEGRLDNGGEISGWLFWSEVTCQTQTAVAEFDPYEAIDFGYFGTNSYQVYVYNAAGSCKTIANASFPDAAMCQSALTQLDASNEIYLVQGCSGIVNTTAPPSWNSVPLCGGGVAGGSSKILTLAGGGTYEVLGCAAGGSDRQTINFLGGSVNVNKHVVPSLIRINQAWIARGGDSFYRVTSVGAYNCRNATGSNRLSVHAYGLAVDINPVQNPYGSALITDMPPEFRKLFLNEGWGWGGNWRSVKDAMHFSKDRGEQGDMRGE